MKTVIQMALVAILAGCTDSAEHALLSPDTIMVGVLPDQSAAQLAAKYAPLIDYLEERTSMDLELFIPENYEAMLDDFSAHRMHIANFGGLTYTEAERSYHAEPLVMRDVDLDFASCYLVPGTESRQSITEFEDMSLSFGPKLSTSGHLMPRYFLQEAGIDPEAFFASVRHSSGHDETAISVRNGEVDVGVANCVIVESMMIDRRLGRNEVRILETTPAYADYVWAVHENLDPAIKIRLRDAFMDLNASFPAHQDILRRLGAHAYLPANRADFEDVRRAARMINIKNTREGS